MSISAIAPQTIQPLGQVDNSQKPAQDVGLAKQIIGDVKPELPAVEDKTLHRKSIFTDAKGVLIAQVKDNMGEIVASYPSEEVLRRYNTLKDDI
jgi:hypothetical protein